MTEKRCTDCKHTKGIGYDFWCGEGHTEYEVFGAETNCPYYEYHDWSKGTPSKAENKRFTVKQRQGATIYSIIDYYGELPLSEGMYYKSNAEKLCKWLNTQHELLNAFCKENEKLKSYTGEMEDYLARLEEKNEQLKKELFEARKDYILETYADNPIRRDERLKALEKEFQRND